MLTKRLKHDLSGQILGGRYKLEEPIGSGGFASVYRALDPRVRKFVAIKVLHPEHTRNITDVERFRNEAAIAGRIDDDHFVKVSDFFQDGEHFCFVMEYLQGSTLREDIQRLQGKPMSWPRAFKLARQICAGLDVAHSHDVVHRDIKPENIFLVRSRHGGEQVKLLDLGVAKILQDHYWSGLRNNLSNTGDIIGSPCYIAPELVQGARVCDPRVDIYSLGIVLYEMVAGVVPFRGSNAYETMYHHVHTEPTRPTVLIEGLGVPRPLENIILSAISKDPARRFRSAREMDAAIRHELGHEGGDGRRNRSAQITPAIFEGYEETKPRALMLAAAPVPAVQQATRKAYGPPAPPPHDHEGATTTKRPKQVVESVPVAAAAADTPKRAPLSPELEPGPGNDFTPPAQGVAERPKVQTFITRPDVFADRSEDARGNAQVPAHSQGFPAPLHGRTWAMLVFLSLVSLFATVAVGLLLMRTIDTRDIDLLARNKAPPEFIGESPVGPAAKPATPPESATMPMPSPPPEPVLPPKEVEIVTSGSHTTPRPRPVGKRRLAPAKPAHGTQTETDVPVVTMASIAARAAAVVKQNCRIHYMAGETTADYSIIFEVDPSGSVRNYDRAKDPPVLADDNCVIAKVSSLVKDFSGASDLRAKFEHKYKVVQ